MGVDLAAFRICNLIALFLQPMLYGIYIVTCGNCATALTRVNGRWRSREEIQWPFLLAGAFLLINTTCSICIQLLNCIEVFVNGVQDATNIPGNLSRWINVMKVRYAAR